MIYTSLIFEGANGKKLDLFNDRFFDTVNIDGLTKAQCSIASSTTPSIDGDTVNNIQATPRNMVFDFCVKSGVEVEMCKRHILDVLKLKQGAKLTLTQGTGLDERKTVITGIIEDVNMPRFNNKVTMQVSFYCSAPFFNDVDAIILQIQRSIPNHHFAIAFPIGEPVCLGYIDKRMTQTFTNDGDVETGMIITIVATGNVSNPVIYRSDGKFIGIIDDLVVNDKVVIDTNRGNKTITKNGVSIISKIRPGSTFLQMQTGDNEFTIDTDDGDGFVYFSISFKRRFI